MKWAVEHGSIKFCEDLLDAGLDPNEPVSFAPPMIWAVLARRPEIVTLLIDRGADPNQLNQIQYQSPLDVAASLGDMPMCILLVEHGADVNHVDIQGLVTLHQGVQSGNYELVEYLLRCGAIPPDSYNVPTPLEYAIMMRNRMRRNSQRWNRQEEIVRILAVRFADEADTLEKEGVL